MSEPKFKPVIEGVNGLSLGISIVVAVAIGVAIGYGLRSLTGISWMLWVGVFWGIGAAVLNFYKAYKKEMKSIENDPYIQRKKKLMEDKIDNEL